MIRECSCPVEHSITKLGHCRTCDYYGRECPENDAPASTTLLTLFECGKITHTDGTEHDFEWATYSDDYDSYGVCRCGLRAVDHDLMTLP